MKTSLRLWNQCDLLTTRRAHKKSCEEKNEKSLRNLSIRFIDIWGERIKSLKEDRTCHKCIQSSFMTLRQHIAFYGLHRGRKVSTFYLIKVHIVLKWSGEGGTEEEERCSRVLIAARFFGAESSLEKDEHRHRSEHQQRAGYLKR